MFSKISAAALLTYGVSAGKCPFGFDGDTYVTDVSLSKKLRAL
jgi:hypothetical protein